jgi:DNA-binding GntR family transcriptional regulator
MSAVRQPHRVLRLRQPVRTSLVDLAYDTIVEAIVDQAIEPGTRLRIEALCAQLGMSSTPVREALIRAADQGLVSQTTNRGFMVTPLLDPTSFRELYQTRRILELGALGAAGWPDEETGRRLHAFAARMPQMTHGPEFRDFVDFNRADRVCTFTCMSGGCIRESVSPTTQRPYASTLQSLKPSTPATTPRC